MPLRLRSRSLSWSITFLMVGGLATTSLADDHPTPRTITVTGVGKVAGTPNVAEIHLGVVTQAATARAAVSENNDKMAKLHALLKERGVAAKDVQTSQFSVSPQYTQPANPRTGQPVTDYVPKIISYQVSNNVEVTARDLAKLGELLDDVVGAGANQIHGINFRIDEDDLLIEQARKKAMKDARAKADLIAGEAGVVVGPPITITETGAPSSPRPMMRMRPAPRSPSPRARRNWAWRSMSSSS